MSLINRLAFAALLGAAAAPVHAADAPASAPPPPAGWLVTVGVGPQVQTSFPGARTVTVWPTGSFDIRRPGDPEPAFTSPDDGIGVPLLDYGWVRAGPVARLIPSRGLSNGNGAFYGLQHVDTSIELGIYGELWFMDHFRLHAEVRQAVTGHQGLDANIGLDGVLKYGAFTFAIGPRMQLGDTQYMKTYFSVTPYQAFLNGRVGPYDASGGLGSVGVYSSVKYQFRPDWSATVFGGYNRLVSQAAASPVPHNLGSLNDFAAGVIVAHSFTVNIPFFP